MDGYGLWVKQPYPGRSDLEKSRAKLLAEAAASPLAAARWIMAGTMKHWDFTRKQSGEQLCFFYDGIMRYRMIQNQSQSIIRYVRENWVNHGIPPIHGQFSMRKVVGLIRLHLWEPNMVRLRKVQHDRLILQFLHEITIHWLTLTKLYCNL